jgi:radical SAM protein with 4Fe4S-binding SPASM domain
MAAESKILLSATIILCIIIIEIFTIRVILMDKNELRKYLAYHRIEGKNLFIIPSLPTWFVLTDKEAILLNIFLESSDRKETISKVSSELQISYCEAEEIYKNTLNILEARKVLGNEPTILAPDPGKFPTNIHLALTHRCNLRCKHCYISAGSKLSHELTLEDWKKGFDNLFSFISKPDITISGGEPTVVKYMPELILFLRPKVKRIVLYTNGLNNINSILDLVDEVQVSMEGLSSLTHDYIRGENSYKKISDFIMNFKNKKKLRIAFTILFHNFDELKNNIDEWLIQNSLDISNMRFNAELEIDGRAEGLPQAFHDFQYKNADEIFNWIKEKMKINEEPTILLKNMRNCGIGISIGIDSNGDIYPCDAFINKQGNILDDNLNNIIKNNIDINEISEIDNIEKCSNCDLKYICLGGCKAKNYKVNGSYIEPICDEKSKYIKYVQMVYDIGL